MTADFPTNDTPFSGPDEYHKLSMRFLNFFVGRKITEVDYSKRFSCVELTFEDGSILRFDGYDFITQLSAGVIVSAVPPKASQKE